MKNAVMIVFALVCLIGTKAISKESEILKTTVEGTLSVQCTPDVYDLAQEWVYEFKLLYPNILVNVNKISNSIKSPQNQSDLTITSSSFKTLLSQGLDNYIVGRQVIVPIISSKNPHLNDFLQNGVSAKALGQILIGSDDRKTKTFNYYATQVDVIKQKIADFTNSNSLAVTPIAVETTEELLGKIKNDANGLGFCLLADIIDNESQNFTAGISIIPIDRNSNGKIDYMEQIYSSPNALLRGVWIGKYPSELTSNLYVQTNNSNVSNEQKVFLNWLFVDGQNSLSSYGFQALVNNELASKLSKINGINNERRTVIESNSNLKAILLIIGIFLVVALLIDFALFRYNRISTRRIGTYNNQMLLNDGSVETPLGLFFDKSHTWAFMEKSGQVKIGMSDFIPSITGTLTGVVLKKTGETIKKGETLLSIVQQGKQLSIKAPISGTIKTLNEKLAHDASLINFSPYNEGWVYAIEPSNWSREIQFLLLFDTFKSWLNSEYLRLKDFLSIVTAAESSTQPAMVLQEGGELRRSILKDLDPKVWEDFQQHFIESL